MSLTSYIGSTIMLTTYVGPDLVSQRNDSGSVISCFTSDVISGMCAYWTEGVSLIKADRHWGAPAYVTDPECPQYAITGYANAMCYQYDCWETAHRYAAEDIENGIHLKCAGIWFTGRRTELNW